MSRSHESLLSKHGLATFTAALAFVILAHPTDCFSRRIRRIPNVTTPKVLPTALPQFTTPKLDVQTPKLTVSIPKSNPTANVSNASTANLPNTPPINFPHTFITKLPLLPSFTQPNIPFTLPSAISGLPFTLPPNLRINISSIPANAFRMMVFCAGNTTLGASTAALCKAVEESLICVPYLSRYLNVRTVFNTIVSCVSAECVAIEIRNATITVVGVYHNTDGRSEIVKFLECIGENTTVLSASATVLEGTSQLLDEMMSENSTILDPASAEALRYLTNRLLEQVRTLQLLLIHRNIAMGVSTTTVKNYQGDRFTVAAKNRLFTFNLKTVFFEPVRGNESVSATRYTSIILPATITTAFKHSTPISPVSTKFVAYRTSSLFDQINRKSSKIITKTLKTNSLVISATADDETITDLQEPVTIQFTPLKAGGKNPQCVFWDHKAGIAGDWSTRGCAVLSVSSPSTVICQCNHLTSFAILMDFDSTSLGSTEVTAVSAITYTGSALSLPGLILTFMTAIIFRPFREQLAWKFTAHFAASVAITNIFIIVASTPSKGTDTCIAVALLLHYFALSMFLWMLAQAALLSLKLVFIFAAQPAYFHLKAAVLAWGLPAVVVLITMATDKFSMDMYDSIGKDYCLLERPALIWALLLPVSLILFINLVAFIAIVRALHNRPAQKGNSDRTQLRIAVIISVLLGATFLSGFALLGNTNSATFYAPTVFNAFFGFFIFIVKVIMPKEPRLAWKNLILCRPHQSSKGAMRSHISSTQMMKLSPSSSLSALAQNGCPKGPSLQERLQMSIDAAPENEGDDIISSQWTLASKNLPDTVSEEDTSNAVKGDKEGRYFQRASAADAPPPHLLSESTTGMSPSHHSYRI